MSGAPGVGAVLVRELGRAAADPLHLCLVLLFPLLGIGFVAAAFSARGERDLPVVLLDADGSRLSRQLALWIDATPAVRVARTVRTLDEGREALMRGDAYAFVLLPEGLERDALRGRSPHVIAFVNGQWLGPASVIARDLQVATMTLSTGIKLRTLETLGLPEGTALALAMPVSVAQGALFNPGLDYVAYLVVALVPAFMAIFAVVNTVHAVGTELRTGTAGEWLATAGGRVPAAFAGKLAPHLLALWCVTIGILLALLGIFHIAVEGSVAVIALGAAVFVLACAGVGLAFVMLTANLRMAMSLAGLYTGPAFAFSGVSFPFFDMPLGARIWGKLLPGTHLIDVLRDQVTMGVPLAGSLDSLLALAAFFLVGTAAALLRAGRVLRDPAYWGRS